ncbi:hypothetical protein BU15DRAFT_50552, partial [Melanogaster broomeanus]
GIVLPSVNCLVGLGCTSIIGWAASCTQQIVCCTGNTYLSYGASFFERPGLKFGLYNGLINVGCTPINVIL